MGRIAVLVPPSEGKALGGRGAPWRPCTGSLPALDGARAEVLAALSTVDGGVVAASPTAPALARYTGVLYRELDWASLPAPAKRRGGASVLTFSGLWGVVAPGDPIPYYKLKMSAALPGLGRLSSWWRPRLTEALGPHLAGRTVWDLLPIEHSAGWAPAEVACRRRYTVRFVDADGVTVAHWNKLLKGALVRRLLIAPVDHAAALADWEHPLGYRLDLDASAVGPTGGPLVFRQRTAAG